MYRFPQNPSKAGREQILDLPGEGFDLSYSDLSQGQYHERSGSMAWSQPLENRSEPHTPGSGDSDSTSELFGSEACSPVDPVSV
jgi:hypothetical protein